MLDGSIPMLSNSFWCHVFSFFGSSRLRDGTLSGAMCARLASDFPDAFLVSVPVWIEYFAALCALCDWYCEMSYRRNKVRRKYFRYCYFILNVIAFTQILCRRIFLSLSQRKCCESRRCIHRFFFSIIFLYYWQVHWKERNWYQLSIRKNCCWLYGAHRVVDVEVLRQCVSIQYPLVRFECFIECAHISLLWLDIASVCASFRLSHAPFKWIMNIRCDKMHISNVSRNDFPIRLSVRAWNFKWTDCSHAMWRENKKF